MVRPVVPAFAGVLSFALAAPVLAQEPPEGGGLPEIVVTATRNPLLVQQAGSAISVVSEEEIRKVNPGSVADALRSVPGLHVVEAGGPGQLTTVLLRGAESRHTMVLIDGIRVGDPSTTGGEFDFSQLVVTDIERIEVLRGPQSALYGSDAIGGVINIITRKGRGPARGFVEAEAGRYATAAMRTGVSGGTEQLSYALSASGIRSDGFSAYGYRIPRLVALYGPFDDDGYRRLAGSARFAWRPAPGYEFETGIYSGVNKSKFDAAFAGFGYRPDTPSSQRGWLTTAYSRLTADSFGGALRNRFTAYGTQSDRVQNDVQLYDFGFGLTDERNRYGFLGSRRGVEYQGDLSLGSFGLLTFGASYELERFLSTIEPGQNSFVTPERAAYERPTRSAFVLHQVALADRLDLSLGGRIDDVEGVDSFVTGRATLAYRIEETGTKLRASVGTGAKAPSLYQQFSIYSPSRQGAPGLRPEESVGVDAGIDQRILGGRGLLSLTGFANRINQMIEFDFTLGPPGPFGPLGRYVNIGQAEINGLEAGLDLDIMPGFWRVKGAYTYLDARDAATGLKLARRPDHAGRIAFAFTPLPRLTIEPSVVLVGERFSRIGEVDRLAPYARFDMRVDYAVTDALSVYLRGENLTDARYQEVKDYGTTGRALYGGVRATF